MNFISTAKNIVRCKLLNDREKFDEFFYHEANNIIYNNVLQLTDSLVYKGSETVGIYLPLKSEPNLLNLFSSNYNFALPRIEGEEMIFVKYKQGDKLEKTKFGNLYHPISKIEVYPNLIVIPGLAFSISGYRLGFGKGHYDRYFSNIKTMDQPIRVGVCFHDRLFESLPFDAKDHKLDYLITDKIAIRI